MSIPAQQIINDLQIHLDELVMTPFDGDFDQAIEQYCQHFEMMTGEQISSTDDARWWFNHWNGNDWLNEI